MEMIRNGFSGAGSCHVTSQEKPRRFGKSYAAQMICAYYDAACDSHSLFEKYRIAEDSSFEAHINKYHVIDLDVTSFISEAKNQDESLSSIQSNPGSPRIGICTDLLSQ